MISPSTISRKAQAIYRDYLRAWFDGNSDYFPRIIPADRAPSSDHAEAIREVTALRAHSKEQVGRGYRVEWEEIRSRVHGTNLFPRRIVIDTEEDLLFLCDKETEFRRLATAVSRVGSTFPELQDWLRRNASELVTVADEMEGLIAVVHYMRTNPRPGLFARELPVPVDTKFVERHERILRQWMDIVLPPDAIRADEDHFARRFGLRYCEPEIFVRVLDPSLQQELGFPFAAIGVPLHSLAGIAVNDVRSIIVENKVTLLTLPSMDRTIALGGLGSGVSLLRHLGWLSSSSVTYWGDIDCDGLSILSRLRTFIPSARSVLMDIQTIERYPHLYSEAPRAGAPSVANNLTSGEIAALRRCATENLRLEQERIPPEDAANSLRRAVSLTA